MYTLRPRCTVWVLGLILALFSVSGQAQVAVLVHGYLGSAASWENSGVNAALAGAGWRHAGVITLGPAGVQVLPGPGAGAENKVYSVELPSIAPIMVQADMLGAMLGEVARRHPGEALTLVGHSAGGVVARTALVRGYAPNATRLITIAAPHLGTLRAVQALDYTDDGWPMSWFKEFFTGEIYDVLRDSRGVLLDLVPPAPGNFLYWLNSQRHPDLEYVSVVRTGPVGLGDALVPVFSQDMNNVPVLRGRSEVVVTPADHALVPADGVTLARLLNRGTESSQGAK